MTEAHAKLGLDAGIVDAPAIAVEAPSHRRELGLFEWHRARWRHAEKLGGEGDDFVGRRRVVVGDIVDGAGARTRDRGLEHRGDVLDMDAVEDLARLHDAARGPGADFVEGAAAGSVDAGEPEDLHRNARLL